MAITNEDSKFLFYSKTLGVNFDDSLMLGRLELYATKESIRDSILKYKTQSKTLEEVEFKDGYAEPLFELLGAGKVDSMDFSDYEKASILHDLNNPIPSGLRNNYSAIVDGGTLEHVFNFPVAIKNVMEMLKPGGHFISITPANNQMGHGFYQFSPELFYRIFSEENGFKIKTMLLLITGDNVPHWYKVEDPVHVKERVMLANNYPASLVLIAEKLTEKTIFAKNPQQSDYVATWKIHKAVAENKVNENEGKLMFLYRKFTPKRIKIIARNVYDIIFKEKTSDQILNEYNPSHFSKIEF